ncbi:class I SAM-dependent methyltransferase [Streptomyces flavotricini]|uniref:Class I SAM-dependent methyltransferase n=1 Tax=Streptomyces flavotricini TaxID=66888 RepID=A0ABS8E9P6_9ACTN|nr:class I SAM-dependent methyltransferase [Streptomyces flavotricini]MCC0097633.1 class I SAM-dependent methyltransferase [Streptomyces flavotricini]
MSDWDEYARRTAAPPSPAFSWTPHPGHGPGLELLELDAGSAVLELGCGRGDRLARCAAIGARPAVGIDVSAVQVGFARAAWGSTIDVHRADAVAWLDTHTAQYSAMFSAFGAHWFTDPARLLPAARQRLCSGGVLVLAHLRPSASPTTRGGPGVQRLVLRWEGEAHRWAEALDAAGFSRVSAQTVPAPRGRYGDTVLIKALA